MIQVRNNGDSERRVRIEGNVVYTQIKGRVIALLGGLKKRFLH